MRPSQAIASAHREPVIAFDAPVTTEEDARVTRAVFAIAVGAGIASMSMNFWVPFLPLYMRELGAVSDADALFWVAVAATCQGIVRLASGPVWGMLSDRYGRKLMFLRALVFASVTTAIAALATQPLHIVVAFVCQGLFSGFVPAATALTSVSVPDRRMNGSLSTVTGAVYLGNTVGPAAGAVMAVLIGYRGAILGAAAMPALAAMLAAITVPRDRIGPEVRPVTEGDAVGATEAVPPRTSARSLFTTQFSLVLLVFFATISLTQVLRLATPVALERIEGLGQATGASGVAFTLAGLASVAGIVLSQRIVRSGRLTRVLGLACLVTAGAHLVLPFSTTAVTFIAAFALISLLQAGMVPATNTLIAANAPRERRGTAFGFASGVQAIGFMVGPAMAAGFAAVSLDLGFVVLAGLFAALAVLVFAAIREPRM
ncbi:MAG: MFS transporter [Chloroflexi bacterium]|nr:MFS transporter [Chloroflexota bacterium]MDA1239317.1 MFS transporter [Chloroflexota bacterium]